MKKRDTRHGPVELKMRVRCEADARLLKSLLAPYLPYWDEFSVVDDGDPEHPTAQRDIEFALNPGTLSRAEVWTLLDAVPGCRLAQETLAPARNFTGQRVHRNVADTLPTMPERRHMATMLAALGRARQHMRMQMARSRRLATRLGKLAANEQVGSPAHAGVNAAIHSLQRT